MSINDADHLAVSASMHVQITQAEAGLETATDLPTRLNGVPHERDVRKFFYKDAAAAVSAAVNAGEKRIKIRCCTCCMQPLKLRKSIIRNACAQHA